MVVPNFGICVQQIHYHHFVIKNIKMMYFYRLIYKALKNLILNKNLFNVSYTVIYKSILTIVIKNTSSILMLYDLLYFKTLI